LATESVCLDNGNYSCVWTRGDYWRIDSEKFLITNV